MSVLGPDLAQLPLSPVPRLRFLSLPLVSPFSPPTYMTPSFLLLLNPRLHLHHYPSSPSPCSYDSELARVRSLVEGVVKELVISASSSDAVKRALLHHGRQLAVLFGRRDLNDKVWGEV